jgi:hypothetical protein
MAKKTDNPDADAQADEGAEAAAEDQNSETQAAEAPAAEAPAAEAAAADAPAAQAPRAQLQVDDSDVGSSYANFCRVTGSPEELIIDFGLNPQPVGVPKDPIHVTQRVVVNFYTAKRLLAALQMSVARHESVFGVLETDVSKRVNPQN